MKIALPVSNGLLCMHFGHCETFAIVEVDESNSVIKGRVDAVPPPHEPGVLPRWLAEKKVDMIVSGGMGQRAQSLFTESGIKVVIGAPAETPEKIVEEYLKGTLVTGSNICDH
ncbi:MAG: NifB/NifX family molybdenum-iron cluster-binding protein [Spirochaetia bacterium]|jgi:predicted Fe-Mo cluster-binding NifX family protein|nr:NifB/NifX family molybdenum-iron cluster-binding protein [Spirochaetia bacterium]